MKNWRKNPHRQRLGGGKQAFDAADSLTSAARKEVKRRRLLRPILAIVAVLTTVATGIEVYQNYFGSADERTEGGAKRLPCEKIAARGLPCNGEGLLTALATNDKAVVDLFIAAKLGPASRVKNPWGGEPQVWAVAAEKRLPGLAYLLQNSNGEGMESFEFPCEPGQPLLGQEGACGVAIEAIRRGYPSLCRILELDPRRTEFRREILSAADEARAFAAEGWAEQKNGGACRAAAKDHSGSGIDCDYAEAFSMSYDACVAQLVTKCEDDRAAFAKRYPTADDYLGAVLERSGAMTLLEGLMTCQPQDRQLQAYARYRARE